MGTNLIHIGYGNILAMSRVIGVVEPKSSHIRRTIEHARDKGLLITLTEGRKPKAAIFTDSGHVVLSALEPETIASRDTN